MEKYFFRILKTVVKINYPSNTQIRAYIDREFSLMKCTPSSPDIEITFLYETFVKPANVEQQASNFFRKNDIIYQHFKAFRREFWISYSVTSRLSINLYIPYQPNLKERFLSPFFEDLDQTCLADFFHNPFLYCLQNISISKGASMLHCSAFSYANKDIVIALTGSGQTGKSSLVKGLTERTPILAFSEDFAFIDVESRIAGLLHQTRVKFKDMTPRERNEYPSNILDCFADRINRLVYKKLKRNNHSRHRSVKDYYSQAVDIPPEGQLKYLYFLNRETDVADKETIDVDSMTSLCVQTIKEEFNNIKSFTSLAGVMSTNYSSYKNINDLLELTESIYRRCFSKISCGFIWLRKYKTIDEASDKLNELIML